GDPVRTREAARRRRPRPRRRTRGAGGRSRLGRARIRGPAGTVARALAQRSRRGCPRGRTRGVGPPGRPTRPLIHGRAEEAEHMSATAAPVPGAADTPQPGDVLVADRLVRAHGPDIACPAAALVAGDLRRRGARPLHGALRLGPAPAEWTAGDAGGGIT